MQLKIGMIGVACTVLLGCTGSSRTIHTAPTAQELARPAHFARRQMLAQETARQPSFPAALDTNALQLSAVAVLELISRAGRDSADRLFFGDPKRSTLCGLPLLDSIATGDSLWLAVARQFLPRRDVCSMQGIRHAVQEALTLAPRRVIALVIEDAEIEFDWTCASMISYDFENRSRMGALNAAHAALVDAALAGVEDRSTSKFREMCLSRLRRPAGRLPIVPTGDAAADTIVRLFLESGDATALRHAAPGGILRSAYRERIVRGGVAWVYIAAALATAAELVPSMRYGFNSAWTHYAINDAIAEALAVAPELVFESLIDYPSVALQSICSGGSTGSTEENRRAKALRRVRAIEPVSRVDAEEYGALRDACLSRLRGGKPLATPPVK